MEVMKDIRRSLAETKMSGIEKRRSRDMRILIEERSGERFCVSDRESEWRILGQGPREKIDGEGEEEGQA